MVDTQRQTSRAKGPAAKTGRARPEWQALDRREAIPVMGFREYWYPALTIGMVGKRPRPWRMLGTDLVFFQGKEKGEVGCVSAICPHRGGNLAEGDCHWRGTISCPYHGWTFDTEGSLAAVLAEGPSSMLMETGIKARAYPTQVLKGMVFVWMGEHEPAPINQDVPPEFFEDDAYIRYDIEYWPCNWRRSVENAADAHAGYVHRDSIRSGKLPHMFGGTAAGHYKIVHERYVLMLGPAAGAPRPVSGKARQYCPVLGHVWPKRQLRKAWTWLFEWHQRKERRTGPMMGKEKYGEEWYGVGQHLPSYVRRDTNAYVYTRCTIPIDEELSREIYFHWARAKSRIGRIYETLNWHLFSNWAFNINFSQQDLKAVNNQRYDSQENFGPNDMTLVWWRRLCTMARDFKTLDAGPKGKSDG
jgi:phenylpropionate dioxygenase-like ring-hydroxylating dioxygenase large terminal subunit